jgi:hypothetical protein
MFLSPQAAACASACRPVPASPCAGIWAVNGVCRVTVDPAPLDGLLEGLVKDLVNQADGSVARAALELLIVEHLNLLGPEVLHLYLPQ